MRSWRRCSGRAARSASSIDSIDSRIVAPSNAQISGCVSSCSHSNAARRELLVRAAVAPALIRVRAVVLRVEERRLHHVDRALDRRLHVLRVGVVPRDDAVEAVVEVDVRIDRVVRDAVAELAQARDRALALARAEVVEDRARHQEPRRPRALLRLDLGHRQRAVEREVDVVAQDQVARLRRAVEARPAVAAGLRRLQQLAVVRRARSRSSSPREHPVEATRRPRARAIVTTSSATSSNDESSSRFCAASKPEKYIGTPSHSPCQPSRSLAPSVARKRPPGRSQRVHALEERRQQLARHVVQHVERAHRVERARRELERGQVAVHEASPAARVRGHGAAAPPRGRRRSGRKRCASSRVSAVPFPQPSSTTLGAVGEPLDQLAAARRDAGRP